MRRVLIEADGLSLAYARPSRSATSLKEAALLRVRRDVQRRRVMALEDVSFRVAAGDFLAVIGPNGAGKSTLLRLLAGVLRPTAGRVRVRAPLATVLDGTVGMHPEASGREGAVLLGALLGRPRKAVAGRIDAIAEWAGLEHYIDQPIRTYSLGMVARLVFATITDEVPPIILLDEVFAVGDAAFQARAFARLDGLVASGTTVLLVTHDMSLARERASRALWLEAGRLKADGLPGRVVDDYLSADHTRTLT